MVNDKSAKYWRDKYLNLLKKFKQSKGRPRLKDQDIRDFLIWKAIETRIQEGMDKWSASKDLFKNNELKDIEEAFMKRPFTSIQSLKNIQS